MSQGTFFRFSYTYKAETPQLRGLPPLSPSRPKTTFGVTYPFPISFLFFFAWLGVRPSLLSPLLFLLLLRFKAAFQSRSALPPPPPPPPLPPSFQFSVDWCSQRRAERESEVRIRINCGILLYARKEVSSSSVSGFEYRGFEEKEKGRGKRRCLLSRGIWAQSGSLEEKKKRKNPLPS